MAFAETANLAVKLTLGGNFTSQMAKAQSSLRKFDSQSRGFKAGAQIGTGIKNSAIIATAALGALAGALAFSVKQGQEAANVQKVYAQAITNSGKVTQANVDALNAQQKALENLAGIDDELIKSSQTRLIQMGLTGKQVEKATPLILDFAKATGIDLLTATKLFGKAAQGNTGALSRYGVAVDKAKAKTDPFGASIDALNKKFGGTTRALSGSLDVRLGALRQNINDIAENVGIKLLPALTKIVDVVGAKLVPALGKFVDRILPDINDGLNQFADALSNGGAENAIRGITDALGPMIDLVKIAAQPVKEIVKAFLSLPKEVQTVLVGAFAVNKLTGGLVTNAAGGIIEAIGKGLLGGIKAPLVNVEGAIVNVNGGIPGVGGGLPGEAAGTAGGVGLATLGVVTAAAVASTWAFLQTHNGPGSQGAFTPTIGSAFTAPTITKEGLAPLTSAITSAYQDQAEAASQLRNAAHDFRVLLPKTPKVAAHILKAGAQRDKETSGAISAHVAQQLSEGAAHLKTIERNAPSVKVSVSEPSVTTKVATNVYITAGGIKRTVAYQTRHGRTSGSRTTVVGGYLGGAR